MGERCPAIRNQFLAIIDRVASLCYIQDIERVKGDDIYG